MKTIPRPCLFFLLFVLCALSALLLVTSGDDACTRGDMDLSVTLEAPESVMMNEPFPVNVTIHHSGDAVSDVPFVIYNNHPDRNGELLFSSSEDFPAGTNELAIGEEVEIEDVTGYRDIYAIIDFGDEATETDEENNLVFSTVEVRENYDDVLLIINNNSAISKEIGHYFAEKRKVKHILYLEEAATTETISRAQFEDTIVAPVKSYLENNSLEDRINYFVTTKGVPLRVSQKNATDDRASVDSELALLNGPYEDNMGNYRWVNNPYHNETERFSHEDYGIYLVTRLTAYTLEEAKALVDKAVNASSPEWYRTLGQGMMILDVDPGRDGGSYEVGNDWLRAAYTNLEARGYDAYLEKNNTFIINQDNVSFYASWGSNDGHDVYPHGMNTGMETDGDSNDVPDDWLFEEGSGAMTRTGEDRRGGGWSVRVNRTVGGVESTLFQDLTPDPLKRYYITGYANLSGVSGSGGVRLEIRHYDSKGTLIHNVVGTYRKGTTSDWVSLNQRHLEPVEGTDYVKFGAVFRNATGLVYLDDIRLIEVVPNNRYLDGALAETIVSTGGRSFTYPTSYGQSLVADIIRAGVTGVKGYVYEPYLSAISHPDILFPRYVDGFNLAESYFCGSSYLGWMGVVAGDPKLSPFTSYKLDLATVELEFSESKVVVETPFTITTTVENVEKLPAENITHTLFEGDPGEDRVIRSFFIPRLAPGEEISFTVPWQINSTGQYDIYSSLDHEDTIDESRENNNELDRRIRVVLPPELRGWFDVPSRHGVVARFGKDFHVNFTIENGGGIEAQDFGVTLKVVWDDGGRGKGGITLLETGIPSLEVEERERFFELWVPDINGNMTLVLEIDPTDVVEESDESNNTVRCPIWVNLPPEPVIELEKEPGLVDEDLTFSASGSSDPDGAIVNYSWSVTGGESFQRTGEEITLQFTRSGNYTIVLAIEDNSSVLSFVEQNYFVNAPPRPYFTISYLNNTKDLYVYNSLDFNASFSDDFESSIREYAWDFGDGNASTGMVSSHRYTIAGSYNVTLTITDEHDATAVLEKKVKVKERSPELLEVVIENGLSFSSFDTIIFNATLSPENPFPVIRYVWDFGDGTVVEGGEPGSVAHAYTSPGGYNVSLTVYEEYGSSATAGKEVYVFNRPPEIVALTIQDSEIFAGVPFRLEFEAFDPEGELENLTVTLTEENSGTLVTTSFLAPGSVNTTLIIQETGIYSATLTITDSSEETHQQGYSFTVLNSRPTAVLSLQQKNPGVRDRKEFVAYNFTAASSHFKEGNITGYRYDFGDGNQSPWSDEPTASHEYYLEGRFTVTLFVRNDLGFEDNTTISVEVVFQGLAEEEGGGDEAGFIDGFTVICLVLVLLAGCLMRKRHRENQR